MKYIYKKRKKKETHKGKEKRIRDVYSSPEPKSGKQFPMERTLK